MLVVWWVWGMGLGPIARAQAPAITPEDDDDPGIEGPIEPEPLTDVFNSDSVLITTFQPENAESVADAQRLYDTVVARFGTSNELVPMSAVPRFETHGYDAAQYMLGCPPGNYAGCALVLGQRVKSDRAVGATVRREPDPIEQDKSSLLMTIHIVDVYEAREVTSFGILVPEGREAEAIAGVANVFDEVVRGDYAIRDLRERGATPDELALARAREERVAASLASLEEELGTAVKAQPIVRLETPKLTREDLAEYADREDLTPWARVGMQEAEYVRFANSGVSLDDWRKEGWGRFGRVMARISAGMANGPWHQRYVGEVLLSDADLAPVQSVQVLEVRNAASASADFELGFGVAPWVDVMFAAALRTGSTSYTLDEDVQNQVATPGHEDRYTMSTWQLGARAQFAPFPHWVARPTVGLGIARWTGAGIPETTRFERLDPPDATLLELIPGVEIDATQTVAVSVRLLESIPLGGNPVRGTSTGDPLMEEVPEALEDRGPGIALQAGLLLRIGPLFRRPPPNVDTFLDEDEP